MKGEVIMRTMTAVVEPTPPSTPTTVKTLADLLERLGVPAERVWLNPPPGQATEADVIYADDHLDRLCELVDGTLVEKAMGNRESHLASVIIYILQSFVLPKKLGYVLAPDAMFRLFGGQIRLPDVAFVSRAQWPSGVGSTPIADFAPELAIEILSPSNTLAEMRRKRSEYFTSGVRLVWIIDPAARVVVVYTGPERSTTLSEDQILDGGTVLPGFSVSVRDIFADLD